MAQADKADRAPKHYYCHGFQEAHLTRALEIHDLAETGQLQLCWQSDDNRRLAPPVAFANPLDNSDHVELGWYFRDYLDNPFGPSKARAEAVETGLRNLGRLLFEVVFRGNDEARSIYAAASWSKASCRSTATGNGLRAYCITWA